jgi:hypothetical protein
MSLGKVLMERRTQRITFELSVKKYYFNCLSLLFRMCQLKLLPVGVLNEPVGFRTGINNIQRAGVISPDLWEDPIG